MNIFMLDYEPKIAAQMHCDKHVVKMILETAQILSTVLRVYKNINVGYQPTHQNHPCVKWAARSEANFQWLCMLGRYLGSEFIFRREKRHKTHDVVDEIWNQYCVQFPEYIYFDFTEPYLAMPDCYKSDSAIDSYRNYYIGAKHNLLYYTKRPPPDWVATSGVEFYYRLTKEEKYAAISVQM